MAQTSRPCETCGFPVTRSGPRAKFRRWCSLDCTPTCAVEHCDRPTETKIGYCLKHYKRFARWGTPEGAPAPRCGDCGAALTRKSPNGPLAKRCEECNRQNLERRLYGHVLTTTRTCEYCGTEFDRRGTNRRFCSSLCRARRAAGIERVDNCIECGSTLDFEVVSPRGRTRRVDMVMCRSCRRDVRYGATVAELVARDGNQCSLCNEDIDLSLKWPHPMCATRDHVIPYSLGGGNDAQNLALAHAVCNTRKGNRVEVTTCSPTAKPSPASEAWSSMTPEPASQLVLTGPRPQP